MPRRFLPALCGAALLGLSANAGAQQPPPPQPAPGWQMPGATPPPAVPPKGTPAPAPAPAPDPRRRQGPPYGPPGTTPPPAPSQPGYPQPGYPQPGYPQPGYPQPGYPQPGYPQPQYPQPGYGHPQPHYPGSARPQRQYPQQPGYPAQPGYPQQPAYPPQPGMVPPGQAPPATPKPKESLSGETRQEVHLLEWMTFGIGFTGGAGAAILDKPDDQLVRGADLRPHYPGFAGIATAFGPSLELRILGYFGIELDILIASDSGSADLTVNDLGAGTSSSFNVDIGHSAVRLPLLFKVFAPGKVATPSIFLGPEFVVVGDEADFEAGPAHAQSPVQYAAHPESYNMFTFGMGIEFNLPLEAADLRLPFSIRGGYNPSVSDRREERTIHTPEAGAVTGESFSTAFKFQIGAQLGLAVHF